MTLTTHIAIATAITKSITHIHPALTFVVALATHYLADAIPHWDYELGSTECDEEGHWKKIDIHRSEFGMDFIKTALDGTIGLALMYLIIKPDSFESILWIGLAAVGGCLPDFLQGIYAIFKLKLLEPLYHFHNRIHTKIKLGPYPAIGVPLQLVILFLTIYFLV